MIKTIETKLKEDHSNKRREVTEIFQERDTDRGHVEEKISIHNGCIMADVALYPIDCPIQKIGAKRRYEGNDPLEIRAKAANFIHDFEKEYCENHDECVFHKLYHDPKSTAGDGMRISVALMGAKAHAYKCSICSGNSLLCYKCAESAFISNPEPATAIACSKEFSLSEK